MGEFNQCSAQLKHLYTVCKLPGKQDEFTAYRILYMLHTLNHRDLIELIGSIKNPGREVKHALAVRSSLSTGDYHAFFKLYQEAPNMSGYLMDHFLERERVRTLLKLVKAYRPTLPLSFLTTTLGFSEHDSKRENEADCLRFLKEMEVVVSDGVVDCKAAVGVVTQQVSNLDGKGVGIKGQIH